MSYYVSIKGGSLGKNLNLTDDRVGVGEEADIIFNCLTHLAKPAESFRQLFV